MSAARRSRIVPRPNVAIRGKQTDVDNVMEAAPDINVSSSSSQPEGTLVPPCGSATRPEDCISAGRRTNDADIPDSSGGFKSVGEQTSVDDKQISAREVPDGSTASARLSPVTTQGIPGLPASINASTEYSSDANVEDNTRNDKLPQLSSFSTSPISRSRPKLQHGMMNDILAEHPDSKCDSPHPSSSPRGLGSSPVSIESGAPFVAADNSNALAYRSSDHPDAYQPESASESSHCRSSVSILPTRRSRIVARPSVNPKPSAPGTSQRRHASGSACDKPVSHRPATELALGHEPSEEGRLPQCDEHAPKYLTNEISHSTDGDTSSDYKDRGLAEVGPVVSSQCTKTASMKSPVSALSELDDRSGATFQDTSVVRNSMSVLEPSLAQPAVALRLVVDTMQPTGCESSSESASMTVGVSQSEDTEDFVSNDRPSAAAASSRRPRVVARPNVKLNDRAATAGAVTPKVGHHAVAADMDSAVVEFAREFPATDVPGNLDVVDDQHQATVSTSHDAHASDELSARAEAARSSDVPDQNASVAGGKPRPRLKIKPNVTSELSRAKQVRPVGASGQLAEAQSLNAAGLIKDSADLVRCPDLSAGIRTSPVTIRNASTARRSDKALPSEMPVGNFSTTAAVPVPRKRSRRKVVQSDQPPDRTKMTMKELLYWAPKSNRMTKPPGQPVKYLMQSSSVAQKTPEYAVGRGQGHEAEVDESDDPVPQVMVGEDGQLMINESSLVIRSAPVDHPTAADVIVEDQRTYVTSGSFRNRLGTKFWTPQDTCKFYKALSYVGTDFSMMERFFPSRSRSELKNKFKKEEKFNKKQVDAALLGKLCFDAEAFTDSEHSSDESGASYSNTKDSGKRLSRCSDVNLSSKKRKTFEDDSDVSTVYDDDSVLTPGGNMPSGSEVAVEPLTDNVQHSKSQNAEFTSLLPDYAPAVFGGSHNEAEKASMTVLPATDPLNVEAGQLIFVVSGANAEDNGTNSTGTAQTGQQVIHVYVVSPPD